MKEQLKAQYFSELRDQRRIRLLVAFRGQRLIVQPITIFFLCSEAAHKLCTWRLYIRKCQDIQNLTYNIQAFNYVLDSRRRLRCWCVLTINLAFPVAFFFCWCTVTSERVWTYRVWPTRNCNCTQRDCLQLTLTFCQNLGARAGPAIREFTQSKLLTPSNLPMAWYQFGGVKSFTLS